jgi:hypothetical protein
MDKRERVNERRQYGKEIIAACRRETHLGVGSGDGRAAGEHAHGVNAADALPARLNARRLEQSLKLWNEAFVLFHSGLELVHVHLTLEARKAMVRSVIAAIGTAEALLLEVRVDISVVVSPL